MTGARPKRARRTAGPSARNAGTGEFPPYRGYPSLGELLGLRPEMRQRRVRIVCPEGASVHPADEPWSGPPPPIINPAGRVRIVSPKGRQFTQRRGEALAPSTAPLQSVRAPGGFGLCARRGVGSPSEGRSPGTTSPRISAGTGSRSGRRGKQELPAIHHSSETAK